MDNLAERRSIPDDKAKMGFDGLGSKKCVLVKGTEMGGVETVGGWSRRGPSVCGVAAGYLDRCKSMMLRFGINPRGAIREAGIC